MADAVSFDPRVTPARADLAAKHLEGKVQAARFARGEPRAVIEPIAPLRQAPAPDARLATEALCGERVTVYESNAEGWSWVQLDADGYVGWMPSAALAAAQSAPTHTITALRALVFPEPDIKTPPINALPFGASVTVTRQHERFAATPFGFIPLVHLAANDHREPDPVAVAERFIGAPYLWGGKTMLGLDCSGLVQIALNACGVTCPRDSDMQEAALGARIEPAADFSNLRRGDLLFWPGHVAIMRDPVAMLHANAFHMAVVAEPLAPALARIAASGAHLRTVKRLP